MTLQDQFSQLRKAVPIWLWPILLYELWTLKLWSEEEARARGADLALLIAADKWGRVHVLAVSDAPAAPRALDGLSRFSLPAGLSLGDAGPAACPSCGVSLAAPRAIAPEGMAWLSAPYRDTS